MTRTERRQKSLAAILDAALAEFGERGYATAAVDGVCARGGISKGLMYHYYTGKDELFCECVRAMFTALAARLDEYLAGANAGSAGELLSGFFMTRERFFAENHNMRVVFEDAMLRTPPQLAEEISRLRAPVKECNLRLLSSLLKLVRLREGVSEHDAMLWFDAAEGLLPELLSRLTDGSPLSFEAAAHRVLDFLLFGIAAPE